MDRNQAWPGEPPSQLAATSTHELFGGPSSSTQQQQQQQHIQPHQQFQHPHPYAHEPQLTGEMGAKKPTRRNRNALSCAECRRLKLKCSRTWPCTVSEDALRLETTTNPVLTPSTCHCSSASPISSLQSCVKRYAYLACLALLSAAVASPCRKAEKS